MPPDIRAGLPTLAGNAPAVGIAGQGPPGSDPLAALFAALLAQSGGLSSQTVPTLPNLRAGAKTDAPFQDESAPAKQATIKTTTESIDSTTQTSTPLPILPPPLLPIQMKPSQMRPITPPTAGVTVGPKTMDTFPVPAALPQETTSAKTDGELPLQGAGSNLSGASAQFPAFLIASPSPKIAPSAPPSATAPVTALTGVSNQKPPQPGLPQPAQAFTSTSVTPVTDVASRLSVAANPPSPAGGLVVSPVAVSALSGSAVNPSAVGLPIRTPLGQSPTESSGQPRPIMLRTSAAVQPEEPSALVSAFPAVVTENGAPESSTAMPSASRSSLTMVYQPSAQGLTVPIEALPRASQVPQLGNAPVAALPDVTLAVPHPTLVQTDAAPTIAVQSDAGAAGQTFPSVAPSLLAALSPNIPAAADPAGASNEVPQKLSLGGKSELSQARQSPTAAPVRGAVASRRETPGELNAPKTFVNTVGIARDGSIATEGQPAREGVTATDGTREGNAATDGSLAMEGQRAMDGITPREGAQATEGILSTAGAAPAAPDQNGVLSTPQAISAPSAEAPEKSLKTAAASADNNTRIDPAGGPQALPTKMLSPDMTPQAVGKRSARDAASATDNTAAVIPGATAPATVQTANTDAKPLTQADRAEMVRQVADGVGAMPLPAKPGAAEQMTLQLHPHDWGQIQVSVKIAPSVQANAAQTVTAHIVAQTPQVKAALESNSGELRSALRASGLHLDRITVTVQSAGTSAQIGTASGGGSHHGMNGGSFSQASSDQKTDLAGNTGPGMPSFAAFTGSHGGRQGSQTPPAYTNPYPTAEPDGEEGTAADMPRRLMLGQVDTRA